MVDLRESGGAPKQLLFPTAVLAVELCLLPLLLFACVFGGSISRLVSDLGFDPNKVANIGFLQHQYKLFVARGIDLESVASDFQIFGAFVWISVAVALLRLLSGPLLFSLIEARAAVRRRAIPLSSPGKLILGFLAAGPIAMWASTYGSASAPLLAFLLKISPRAYIRLETFVFVGSTIFCAEGLLLFLLLVVKRWRNRGLTP